MRRIALATIVMLALPAATGAAELDATLANVRSALDRGYGATCSLEMTPVDRNGYYRCLDIGPYRFVEEYGRTRAFVITPGQPPFEVLVSDQTGARFSYKGPWETDLSRQVADWYAFEIGGGRTLETRALGEAEAVSAARDTVSTYLESLEPTTEPATSSVQPAPVQAAPVQPQVFYIVPPGFSPQQYSSPVPQPLLAPGNPLEIPSTGVPSIPGVQQPGVLVAPGVVTYPVP